MNLNLQDAPQLSADEQSEVAQQYEERADHLELSTIATNTTLTSDSEGWIAALTGLGAKLLVGPRGCGKTHLMRYSYIECAKDTDLPFAVYTNLNRYYRLEPLARRRPDALSMFYVWVLSNILVGAHEALSDFAASTSAKLQESINQLEFERAKLEDLIGTLEQGRPFNLEQSQTASRLTIDRVKVILVRVAELIGRKRVVLFLDDAALTLAPEYLSHFFDIFRALKGARLAVKASVYPGTTEYGPNFHVAHEAEIVFVWKRVTDQNYLSFMLDIGRKRFPDLDGIPEDTCALLAFAAFGVPRAFMSLVRAFLRNSQKTHSVQSAFNQTIDDFLAERKLEYLTLKDKKPQFASIVDAGASLFETVASNLTETNQALADGSTRQLVVGIDSNSVGGQAYVERMLLLLEEVGLMYKLPAVSHGDRDYYRFAPHIAALLARRAFSRKGGFSPKFSVEMLQRQDDKHPLRRSMSTLLSPDILNGLALDLPNCRNCGAKRVEGAKYCFECGEKLADESTYDRLMSSPLAHVPGLTAWQRDMLVAWESVPRTVGEFMVLQDPGTTLRKIPRVGKIRARTIIDAVSTYLDEYLS
jgi:hypothetical protein